MGVASAQTVGINEDQYQLHIKRAKGKIILDGKLNELDWTTADTVSRFWETYPKDSTLAKSRTEVKVLFDNDYLYVGAKCYQKKTRYTVYSLKRDFPQGTTDLFSILIDPFRDKQNGFGFAVSPLGVQREGIASNGTNLNLDWDNKWYSKVINEADYWTVEFAIPFKTLRYKLKEGVNLWDVNFIRYDQSYPLSERSHWAPMPRQSPGNNMAFSGTMVWDDAPPAPGSNISLIPSVLTTVSKDYVAETPTLTKPSVGLDAKIALTSSINLDLTLNPDFAQAEADGQQINLSRFELYFPERRRFFLENGDLFGTFGFDNINPFFSRRIGLATDSLGNNVPVPIIGGAKLSGSINDKWRVGVLDVLTDRKQELKLPSVNFTMAAAQCKLLTRSNLSFYFVNKQSFKNDTSDNFSIDPNKFNRVIGADFNYYSKDGLLQGTTFFHRSFSPSNLAAQYATGANLTYGAKLFNFKAGVETVGENYNAETGYVPRMNYYRAYPNFNLVFYPKSLSSWSTGLDADLFWRRTDNKLTDWYLTPIQFDILFKNASELLISPLRWEYTYLSNPFDPTNTGGKQLAKGTEYSYRSFRVNYFSDFRSKFNFNLQSRIGEYFNGNIFTFAATFGYRKQPYGVLSMNFNYSRIRLPSGYSNADLLLIGPKLDVSFSKSLFFTSLVQFNNQQNNLSVYTRLQWRYKPVSDFFLVYTDNYLAHDDNDPALNHINRAFQSKNRALVVKCNYWLNL